MPIIRKPAAAGCIACLAAAVHAQGPAPADGHWHGAVGAGLSLAEGNRSSQTVTTDANFERVTDQDRWALSGKGLYARTEGATTGEQARLGARHEWNFMGSRGFAYAAGGAEHDRAAGLTSRLVSNGGVGWKLSDAEDLRWSLFTGLGVTDERYMAPRTVDGQMLRADTYVTIPLGEESSHKLTGSLSARQRVVVYPNMKRDGEWRADVDAGVVMGLTNTLGLNVGLTMRYDTTALPGTSRSDTLVTTGLTYKFQ